MKMWGFILGVVALVASIALGVSWKRARQGIATATASVQKFTETANTWQAVADMKEESDDSHLRTDRMRLKGANIEIEIAELQGGRGMKAAQAGRSQAEAMIAADEDVIRSGETLRLFGPGPEFREATGRVKASQGALTIYAAIKDRDEHLAYAVGVLWLAFGFAVALTKR